MSYVVVTFVSYSMNISYVVVKYFINKLWLILLVSNHLNLCLTPLCCRHQSKASLVISLKPLLSDLSNPKTVKPDKVNHDWFRYLYTNSRKLPKLAISSCCNVLRHLWYCSGKKIRTYRHVFDKVRSTCSNWNLLFRRCTFLLCHCFKPLSWHSAVAEALSRLSKRKIAQWQF